MVGIETFSWFVLLITLQNDHNYIRMFHFQHLQHQITPEYFPSALLSQD